MTCSTLTCQNSKLFWVQLPWKFCSKYFIQYYHTTWSKIENILKGSLDSIPSLHIQWKFKLWTGKFTWDNKAKHCWVMSTNFSFSKVTSYKIHTLKGSLDSILSVKFKLWAGKFASSEKAQQCFALLSQVNLPPNNLNFHCWWRWWNWI